MHVLKRNFVSMILRGKGMIAFMTPKKRQCGQQWGAHSSGVLAKKCGIKSSYPRQKPNIHRTQGPQYRCFIRPVTLEDDICICFCQPIPSQCAKVWGYWILLESMSECFLPASLQFLSRSNMCAPNSWWRNILNS